MRSGMPGGEQLGGVSRFHASTRTARFEHSFECNRTCRQREANSDRGTKRREFVGHPQLRLGEAVERCGSAAGAPRSGGVAVAVMTPASGQDSLQVRRVHLVTESGAIDFAQGRHRELVGRQANAMLVYDSFRGQPRARVLDHRPVVEGHLRKRGDRVPGRVPGSCYRREGDQAQVGGGDSAVAGDAVGIAEDDNCSRWPPADVDLLGQNCLRAEVFQVLVDAQCSAG